MNDLHGVAALAEGVDLSGIEQLKELPKLLFQVLSEARQAADLICPSPSLDDAAGGKAG